MIVFEQSVKARLTPDLGEGNNRRRLFVFVRADHSVANSLARPTFVEEGDVFRDDVVGVDEIDNDEVIEGLVFQTLNPSLDERVQIRRSRPDWHNFDGVLCEHVIKVGRVIAVEIAHDRGAA